MWNLLSSLIYINDCGALAMREDNNSNQPPAYSGGKEAKPDWQGENNAKPGGE